MAYDGTTFTAIKLDDKDVNDPNSGFYTAQATTEQINSIPADAKAEGELLYNKTTGKLVVYNGIAGGWETVNSSEGFNGNVVINSYSTAPTDPVEGEVYYNTTTNTYQVYTDGEWQDITTSDTEIVAKSHATDPTSPTNGLIYYNTTDHILRTYTNAAWSYLERAYATYYSTTSISISNSMIQSVPVSPKSRLFTISNNGTITYTGTNSISASVAGQISFQVANNASMSFALRRNGVLVDTSLSYTFVTFEADATRRYSVAINTFIDLQPGDYLNVTCTASPTTTITIFTILLKVESL